MLHSGGQSDCRTPSSPRRESSSGSGTSSNMATFSLLGQQMKNFAQPSQHHQNQTSSNASSIGFPLGGSSQQSHAHSQQQQSQSLNGGGSGVFQTLQQLSNVGQGFNQQQQQQFSGQMADQGLQDSNTTNHLVGGGVPVQVLMNGLAMLQQKIQQLQALVPLLTQSVQGQSNATVVIAQQQAASAAVSNILAQLAAAATGMLSQQVPVVDQNQAPNLELSQLLNVGGNQSLNQFQQSGFDCPLGTSLGTSLGELLGNNLLANNFSDRKSVV